VVGSNAQSTLSFYTLSGIGSFVKQHDIVSTLAIYIHRHHIIMTSHASIAYRKQLPPQRTVGTIGSVWQESTHSMETTGPANRYENEQSEMRNDANFATTADWLTPVLDLLRASKH